MIVRLALAGFLLAHAAIHIAFIAPAPPATADGPAWPFTTNDSWLFSRLGVGPDGARLVALGLVVVTIAAFVLAALVAVGVAPISLWAPAIAMGAAASLGLLVAFFHPWLALGLAIDVGLLWATLVAGWTPLADAPVA
jgi:hypothetical protein